MGRRVIFGYSAANPSRVAYYFLNGSNRVVQISLRLHIWKTEGIWERYDSLLRASLALQ